MLVLAKSVTRMWAQGSLSCALHAFVWLACMLSLVTAHGTNEALYSSPLISDDPVDHARYRERHQASLREDGHTPLLEWPGNKIVVPSVPEAYQAQPAAFGPSIEDPNGMWGHLVPISEFLREGSGSENSGCIQEPHDAAAKSGESTATLRHHINRTLRDVTSKTPPRDWVALVERGFCTFTDKVRTAQKLGAKAVIVGDSPSGRDSSDDEPFFFGLDVHGFSSSDPDDTGTSDGRLVTMHADEDTSDIHVPSGFVIRSSYLELLNLAQDAQKKKGSRNGLKVAVFLDQTMSEMPLLDLGVLLFLLPSLMTLVAMLLHQIQEAIKRYKERAPVHAIKNLPCYVWHPRGTPWELVANPSKPADAEGQTVSIALPTTWSRVGAWLWERVRLDSLRQRLFGHAGPEHSQEPRQAAEEHVPLLNEVNNSDAAQDAAETGSQQAGERHHWYIVDECPICLCEFEDGFVPVPRNRHR